MLRAARLSPLDRCRLRRAGHLVARTRRNAWPVFALLKVFACMLTHDMLEVQIPSHLGLQPWMYSVCSVLFRMEALEVAPRMVAPISVVAGLCCILLVRHSWRTGCGSDYLGRAFAFIKKCPGGLRWVRVCARTTFKSSCGCANCLVPPCPCLALVSALALFPRLVFAFRFCPCRDEVCAVNMVRHRGLTDHNFSRTTTAQPARSSPVAVARPIPEKRPNLCWEACATKALSESGHWMPDIGQCQPTTGEDVPAMPAGLLFTLDRTCPPSWPSRSNIIFW
jgi:hypothetical protein